MRIIESSDAKAFLDESLNPYFVAISMKMGNINEGDMSYSCIENENNRKEFFKLLNLESRNVKRNKQIHSKKIITPVEEEVLEADGLVSNNPKDTLMLLTADCYNIFFTTCNGSVFGAVHAGWKGILAGVVEELAKILKNESKILVAQGICRNHFEVGREVADSFRKLYKEKFIEENESIKIDLRGIINSILKDHAEVINLNLCNVCRRNEFFSYREGYEKSRNMSIIWRKDD